MAIPQCWSNKNEYVIGIKSHYDDGGKETQIVVFCELYQKKAKFI